MFLHTNPTISRIFERHLASGLQTLRPILLYGPTGIGKFTYLSNFVRSLSGCTFWNPFEQIEPAVFETHCNCEKCAKILANKSIDVLVLSGEGIKEFKESVQEFVNHNPVEMDQRWLILRNLNLYSSDTLNTFLKILEEPYPYLKILATTSTLEGLPKAIVSRFHPIQMFPLSQDDLSTILTKTPALKPFKNLLSKYEFDSVSKLVVYRKLLFEDTFTNLFIKPNNIVLLERDIGNLIVAAKADPNYRFEDIIGFFLQYFIDQVYGYCDINDTPNLKLFRPYFNRVVKKYSSSLFKYLDSSINYYYMNVENQITTFITSTYMLKILTHA